jgi:hypothetical protein
LSVVVHRLDQVPLLRQAALPVPSRLPIYLKLNSGMNRLGLTAAQLPAARRELTALAPAARPADSDDALCRSRRVGGRALHRLAARTFWR